MKKKWRRWRSTTKILRRHLITSCSKWRNIAKRCTRSTYRRGTIKSMRLWLTCSILSQRRIDWKFFSWENQRVSTNLDLKECKLRLRKEIKFSVGLEVATCPLLSLLRRILMQKLRSLKGIMCSHDSAKNSRLRKLQRKPRNILLNRSQSICPRNLANNNFLRRSTLENSWRETETWSSFRAQTRAL